jgi:hypothetical protein
LPKEWSGWSILVSGGSWRCGCWRGRWAGASTYDVGVSGRALRLADDRRYSVFTLLRRANRLAGVGVIPDGARLGRPLIWSVFHGINTSGGII